MPILKNKYFKVSLSIIIYLLLMFFLTDFLANIPFLIFRYDYYSFLVTFANYTTFFISNSGNYITSINAFYQFFIYALTFFMLTPLFYSFLKSDFLTFNKNKTNNIKYLFISLALYFAINMLVNTFVNLISIIFDLNLYNQNQAGIESMIVKTNLYSYFLIIPICIIGPFIEEYIFRKCIFTLIPNKSLAILISCLCFGLLHTISYDYSISNLILITLPYCFAGLAFSYCYTKTNNLLYPYLLHAGLNSFSFILLLGGF